MELVNKKHLFNNELLFILYFWRLVILKPITTTYVPYGMLIVLVYTFLLVAISVFINYDNRFFIIKVEPIGCLLVVIYCVFFLDYIFRPNPHVVDYMYELLLYGVLPAYFLLKIRDFDRLIRIFWVSSVLLFGLYFIDPINGFRFFDNYMTFGFQLAFPAFMGIDIGRSYYKKKWVIIIEILCLIELFVFANRSCILSVIVYFILKDFFISKYDFEANKWKTIRRILLAMAAIVVAINWENIILFLYNIIEQKGISSYSFSQYVYYIEHDSFMTASTTGGRSGIWDQAIEMFKMSPVIGNGSGSFIEKYEYYTHNIFTDLLVQYGIIGLIYIGYYIIKAVARLFTKTDSEEFKIILVAMFCLWFPKLFFSTNMFNDMGLWCFITVALSKRFYTDNCC